MTSSEPHAPNEPNDAYAPKAHEVPQAPIGNRAPQAPIETMATTDRRSVVVRPGLFLTLVIASAFLAGGVIYWLLRTMRI